MSASNTAPSSAAGECLVCGASTSTRCSSCASKSGFDLFFCSKEHQKLIWPFHRLVCGDRAHPFRLPTFSPEEALNLTERCFQPCTNPEDSVMQNQIRLITARALGLTDQRTGKAEISKMQAAAYFDTLIGVEAPLRQPTSYNMAPLLDSDHLKDDKSAHIGALRGLCAAMLPSTTKQTFVARCMEEFFAHYNACTAEYQLDSSSPWHSELCHRMAAAIGLIVQHITIARQTPTDASAQDLWRLRTRSLKHLITFISETSPAHLDGLRNGAIQKLRVALENTMLEPLLAASSARA
ncbi:hypothetical protein JCM10908_001971 [Rhodotorula pacifica]|uniref:zinc finger MYND domain-containing protein n=1 Tax=Rhodotorula pacifica TaxID=1495444 RepID=UPI00316D79D0